MSWTVGNVSRQRLLKKWAFGPDAAAIFPLVAAVTAACAVGVFAGTRTLVRNPDLAVSKQRRGIDVTESKTLRSESKAGDAYHDHGFRSYLRGVFFTGPSGTLDNSQPFLGRSAYGKE
jgi:hypothetical protein